MKKQMFSVQNDKNNIFASGQAIPAASDGVLRPTSHGSRCEPDAKIALCGLAASSGELNPRWIKGGSHSKLFIIRNRVKNDKNCIRKANGGDLKKKSSVI